MHIVYLSYRDKTAFTSHTHEPKKKKQDDTMICLFVLKLYLTVSGPGHYEYKQHNNKFVCQTQQHFIT